MLSSSAGGTPGPRSSIKIVARPCSKRSFTITAVPVSANRMALRNTFSIALRSKRCSPSTMIPALGTLHPLVHRARLEPRVLHDLAQERCHVNGLARMDRLRRAQLRELQHLSDQRIQALRFELDTIELSREIFARATCKAERHA